MSLAILLDEHISPEIAYRLVELGYDVVPLRDRHQGVLVVGRDWSQEESYWALRQFLESGPDPVHLQNQVVRLLEATSDFIQERS